MRRDEDGVLAAGHFAVASIDGEFHGPSGARTERWRWPGVSGAIELESHQVQNPTITGLRSAWEEREATATGRRNGLSKGNLEWSTFSRSRGVVRSVNLRVTTRWLEKRTRRGKIQDKGKVVPEWMRPRAAGPPRAVGIQEALGVTPAAARRGGCLCRGR